MCRAFQPFSPPAILVIGMSLLTATGWAAEEPLSPLRFAKQIEAFARQNLESPPDEGVKVTLHHTDVPDGHGKYEQD